jgi:predicted ABC-type sugar transport system permease subunit
MGMLADVASTNALIWAANLAARFGPVAERSIATLANRVHQVELLRRGVGRVRGVVPSAYLTLHLALGLLMAVAVAVFAALRPEAFATVTNLRNILIGGSVLLVMAVGMTFVIITAGIDLSVGSVLVFSSVIAINVMTALGNAGWGVVAVGILTAMVTGSA